MMEEEDYHELDLDYASPPLSQDDHFEAPISAGVDLEYQAYMDSSSSLADAYFGVPNYDEYVSESGGSSDSRPRTPASVGADYGGIYGGGPLLQLEKEIDYLPIKDWQGELQTLMKMEDCLEKWQGLARLGLDFQHAAGLYARVIVSESKLAENQKTIHTANIGGVAGGTNTISFGARSETPLPRTKPLGVDLILMDHPRREPFTSIPHCLLTLILLLTSGIKVICQGILFKIAIDKIGMYGSDANAAKAAGHEFKSSAAFFDLNLPDVQIPLMAIIDYRGFRVTATSLLPISGRDTLIYGSSDAGKTVATMDPHFNSLMERAGTLLNLKPHRAGRDNPKTIYMPVDVEGHVTLKFKTKQPPKTDSPPPAPVEAPSAPARRSYVVLDLARLFPPQLPAPNEKGSNHRPYLYQLLRPEFVKTNPVPLSSDAFSPFNAADPRAKEHNDEVAAACHRLKTVRIPQFASFLQKSPNFGLTPLNELTCQAFIAAMHTYGINIRFLGLVRHCLTHLHLRQIALTEMVSRVVKDQINQELRNTTETVQLPVEEPYREAVVGYLNRLFGAQTADDFWRNNVRPAILKKFNLQSLELSVDQKRLSAMEIPKGAKPSGNSLTLSMRSSQSSAEANLRLFVDPLTVWERVSQLTGVTLRKDSLKVMVGGFGITPSDIKVLKSRIRVTDLVNRALAIAISMDAKEKRGTESYRLYLRAHELFHECVEVSAANADTYYHWGVMLQEMALHAYFNSRKISLRLLKAGALPKLAQAVHINPGHLDANAALGWTLLEFLLHHQRFEAVNLKTSTKEALKDTTRILERAAHHIILSLGTLASSKDGVVNPELSHSAASLPLLPSLNVSGDTNDSTSAIPALDASSGSSSSGTPAQGAKRKKDKDKKSKKSSAGGSSTLSDTTTSLPKLKKKQVIENTVSPDEYKERFEELAEQIELSNASLFMALAYALWSSERIKPLLFERGAVIGELDLVDASFLPKKGFALLSQVCPNLQVLRLRNAVFLDSKTASEMLRSPDAEETVIAAPTPVPPHVGSAAYTDNAASSGSLSRIKPIRYIQNKINAMNSKTLVRDASFSVGSHVSALPHLRILRLVCCEHLTDIEGFEKMIFPALEILDVEKTGLSDQFYATRIVARNLPTLADLIICGSQITDTSLNRIASQFGPQLRSLELSQCLNIQYVSCFNLMINMPTLTPFKSLTHLNMSGCRSLSASSVAHFVKSLAAPPAPSATAAAAATAAKNAPSPTANLLSSLNSSSAMLNLSVSSSISAASGAPSHSPPPSLNSSGTSPAPAPTSSNSKTLSTSSKSLHNSSSDLVAPTAIQPGSASPLHTHNPHFFQQHYHHSPSSSSNNINQMSTPAPAALPSTAPTSERETNASISTVATLGISAATLKSVSKLPYTLHVPSLMFINLDGCTSLTEDVWNAIPKKCPLLVSVSMEKASATGVFLELLGAHCQRLERFHAPACKNLEPNALMKMLQGCPNVTYIDASFWNWNVQELNPKLAKSWSASSMPQVFALEKLYICAWPMEEAKVSLLISRSPSLRVADLSNCHALGPQIFTVFSSHCPKLKKITANAFTPSDQAVEVLTAGCPELANVQFLRATELTDSSLLALSRCKKLTRLNLTHSPFITNEGIQLLVTACPTLTRIGVKGAKLVTSEFMFDKLRHNCSELGIEMDVSKHVFLSFPI